MIDVLSSFTGEKYVAGDIVTPSPSAVFELGESISLDARLIGQKSQVDRVAFYANGVEIEGEVSAMIGGYYSTMFQPSDPRLFYISTGTVWRCQG